MGWEREIRGLNDFCQRNRHVIINTWFKKPKRLYTWNVQRDQSRHQLDYILVKERLRNSVKDVQTLPGADIDSDHNLLAAKISTRLKKIIRFPKKSKTGFGEVTRAMTESAR
jgi:hypothetical protein